MPRSVAQVRAIQQARGGGWPSGGQDGALFNAAQAQQAQQAQQEAVNQYLRMLSASQQPSGPSGPSGGGGAAPAYDPNSDPAYHTYLRSLDLQGEGAQRDAAGQMGQIDSDLSLRTPRIAEQGEEQRRNLDSRYEGRGMLRSGERLRTLALQQRAQAQQTTDLEADSTRRKADVQRNLEGRLSEIARLRAEQALNLSARNRL